MTVPEPLIAAACACVAGIAVACMQGSYARWLPLVLILAPVLLAFAWAFPSDDDWCYGAAHHGSWLASQGSWYMGWSGRYTATAVLTAWGCLGDAWTAVRVVYPLVLLAITASIPLVGGWLLRECAPTLARADRWWVTLVLFSTFLLGMPDPTEGVFWLAGAMTYGGGLAILLAGIAAMLRFSRRGGGRAWAMAALLLALAPGANETLAIILLLPLLVILRCEWGRPRQCFQLAALVVIAGLGLTVVLLCPGNGQRMRAVLAESGHPPSSVMQTLASLGGLLGRLYHDMAWTPVLLAAFLVGPVLAPVVRGQWWVWLLSTILVMAIACLPMAYVGLAPARAVNPLVAVGIIGVALSIAAAMRARLIPPMTPLGALALMSPLILGLLLGELEEGKATGFALGVVAGIAYLVCQDGRVPALQRQLQAVWLAAVLCAPTWISACIDIGRSSAYLQAMHARLHSLVTAVPGSSLSLPMFLDAPPVPRLTFHADIRPGSESWVNRGMAGFFGLREIRGVPPVGILPSSSTQGAIPIP